MAQKECPYTQKYGKIKWISVILHIECLFIWIIQRFAKNGLSTFSVTCPIHVKLLFNVYLLSQLSYRIKQKECENPIKILIFRFNFDSFVLIRETLLLFIFSRHYSVFISFLSVIQNSQYLIYFQIIHNLSVHRQHMNIFVTNVTSNIGHCKRRQLVPYFTLTSRCYDDMISTRRFDSICRNVDETKMNKNNIFPAPRWTDFYYWPVAIE